MMKIIYSILLLSISFLGFGQIPDLIIKDVNIIPISENKVIYKKSLAITSGIIIQINDFKKIKKGENTQVINGKGKYIMPGLAEKHSHLPAPEKIDTYLVANVASWRYPVKSHEQ